MIFKILGIKNIAKSTLALSSSRVFAFVFGLIRAKLNAIFLGTFGVGLVNQLQDLTGKLSSISLAEMNVGLTKQIAENNNEAKTHNILVSIRTYITLIIPLVSLVYILGMMFSGRISEFVLGERKYEMFFIIAFVSFPLLALRSVFSSILTGMKSFKIIALNEIIVTSLSFILYIPLIIIWGVKGAIINLSLTAIAYFILLYFQAVYKTLNMASLRFWDILKVKYSKTYAKEMILIGGIGMTLGYYEVFLEITSRAILVKNLGLSQIGLYGPILAWSGLFAGFIIPSISTYLLPRLSEAKSNQEVVEVTNDVFRLMTFLMVPFLLLGISYRDVALKIFYSKEFLPASVYLPYHFLGTLFTSWVYIFTLIFTPTGRIKKFIPFGFANNTISFAMIYLLTTHFGLWAWVAKFLITPILATTFLYFYFRIEINFRFHKENLLLLFSSILAVVILIIIPVGSWLLYISGPILLFLFVLLLSVKEKQFVKKQLAIIITKITIRIKK